MRFLTKQESHKLYTYPTEVFRIQTEIIVWHETS